MLSGIQDVPKLVSTDVGRSGPRFPFIVTTMVGTYYPCNRTACMPYLGRHYGGAGKDPRMQDYT